MTLCPVAIAVSCKNCPVVSLCPLKGVIGDYKPDTNPTEPAPENAPVDAKKATHE